VFAIRGLDHPPAWDAPAQIAALKAAGVGVIELEPAVFTGAKVRIPEALHG
jgi:hypothetical protein